MSLETKNDISNDYLAAGMGAAVGSAGAKSVINKKYSTLANKTVEAFNGNLADCDAFVKKHNSLVTKSVDSKKGFFGKINKFLSKNPAGCSDEAISGASKDILGDYFKKAAKKTSGKYSGDTLQEETLKLRDRLLSKDILRSYKNASKFKNIAIVLAAGAAGLFAGCIAKEYSDANKKDKAVDTKPKTETAVAKSEKSGIKDEIKQSSSKDRSSKNKVHKKTGTKKSQAKAEVNEKNKYPKKTPD